MALLEILTPPACGFRSSSDCRCPLGRDGKTLIVRGKGGKERMVPLTEPAIDALAAYTADRDRSAPAGKGSRLRHGCSRRDRGRAT